jgi:RND family efflux transporter MFP subunit
MKRIIVFFAALIILVSCNQDEKDLNKDISIPVSVVEIKPQSIEKYIGTTGTVNASKEAVLRTEISGNYKLMNNPATGRPYVLGDKVKAGQILIIVENKEYKLNIKQNSLKLRLEITRQVFEKQKSLYEKGGVTLSDLRNSEIEYINAQNTIDDALLQLQKMMVVAPFNGVIVELPYKTPNTKIETNQEVMKIMDYGKLLMEVNLPEKNYKSIKSGQEIRIMNYTFPDDTLEGRIAQISPAINPETRSFKAVININNKDLLLLPGMFAKGEIIVDRADSTFVIKKEVILTKQNGNTVFVINKGLAEERIITFGLENPDEVQVLSGLKENDRMVVKGFETLRDRSKVKVVK